MPFDNSMKFETIRHIRYKSSKQNQPGALIMRTRYRPTYKQREDQTDKRTNQVNKQLRFTEIGAVRVASAEHPNKN
ncbi:hypothetical protein NM27_2158 [Neisseria meningitidis NM27]|nr:hypothetical protein NM27_2158 [Neisseria meningitidis NM27]